MSKNIDEVLARFEGFIEPAIDKGFDDGSRTGEKGQAAYRNRLGWREDLKDFIKTALQDHEESLKKDLAAKVYEELLPTGQVDAFELIKGIKKFYEDLLQTNHPKE